MKIKSVLENENKLESYYADRENTIKLCKETTNDYYEDIINTIINVDFINKPEKVENYISIINTSRINIKILNGPPWQEITPI